MTFRGCASVPALPESRPYPPAPETRMRSIAVSLLVAALLVNLGCKSESKSSGTASGETQTTTSMSGSGPGSGATGTGMSATAKSDAPAGQVVTTASGLQYQDIVIGTGAEAKAGNTV